MQLRELEVLEKIASSGHLNVVLGGKGLAERVVDLLLQGTGVRAIEPEVLS